jgi:hypothetical protein
MVTNFTISPTDQPGHDEEMQRIEAELTRFEQALAQAEPPLWHLVAMGVGAAVMLFAAGTLMARLLA